MKRHVLNTAASLLIIIVIASGCSRSVGSTQLSSAEDLIEANPDSALAILDKITPNNLHGDYQNAMYAMLLMRYQSRSNMKNGSDSLANVVETYLRSHGDDDNIFSSRNRFVFLLVFICVIVMDFVILMMRYRVFRKNEEIEHYIDLTNELSLKMQSSEASVSSKMSVLFSHQYELLNNLCNTYYETVSCNKDKEAIYKLVKNEIRKFTSDTKTINEIENVVNQSKHNVMNIVRKEFPDLKESDYRFICFVYAEFSVKAISIFTGLSVANIFTKKSRFKSKLKSLNSPNATILLENLP
jgi:hypothetical protein